MRWLLAGCAVVGLVLLVAWVRHALRGAPNFFPHDT